MDKKIVDGKEYDVTLGAIKNGYVRPYSQIGSHNESKEYVSDRTNAQCGNKGSENTQSVSGEKEYVSTIGVMNKTYVRPYNRIGYNNDACEGKPRDDDLER